MEPIKKIFSKSKINVETIKEETTQEETLKDEGHEELEVERHQENRMETFTTVELSPLLRSDELPKVELCCFCINLRLGINVWLLFESILWIFLFVVAFYYETKYINEDDLMLFIEETNEWYFYLIFGDRFYLLDQKIRSKLEKEDVKAFHSSRDFPPSSLHHSHQFHLDVGLSDLLGILHRFDHRSQRGIC